MTIDLTADTRILVSACLLGVPCQYDGQAAKRQLSPSIREAVRSRMIPVCPEQLAGLPTPRQPVEIVGGDGADVLREAARVLCQEGHEYSAVFRRGADIALQVARLTGATIMVTQKRSPSCSSAGIYDGTFSHTLRSGCGVCAALLQAHGLQLWDVDAFETALLAALQ